MKRSPEVTNAADRGQVKRSRRRTEKREARFLAALRSVLATPEGRLVFGERDRGLLARLAVDSSPFSRDAIEMAFNVGSQNAGRMIKALIIAADEQAYLLMENECRQLARHDDNETTAAHMLPADDAGEQED